MALSADANGYDDDDDIAAPNRNEPLACQPI